MIFITSVFYCLFTIWHISHANFHYFNFYTPNGQLIIPIRQQLLGPRPLHNKISAAPYEKLLSPTISIINMPTISTLWHCQLQSLAATDLYTAMVISRWQCTFVIELMWPTMHQQQQDKVDSSIIYNEKWVQLNLYSLNGYTLMEFYATNKAAHNKEPQHYKQLLYSRLLHFI